MKKTTVAVFAGSSEGIFEEYKKDAYSLGEQLAKNNCHTLWGGGKEGVMGALMSGVCNNGGTMEAHIFEKWFSKDEKFPSAVTSVSSCKSENDRNEIFLKADFQVALAGGVGSLLEIAYALNEKLYHQPQTPPLIILSSQNHWRDLDNLLHEIIVSKFGNNEIKKRINFFQKPGEVIEAMTLS